MIIRLIELTEWLRVTTRKDNVSILEPRDDIQFLKLVCMVSKYDLEKALTMLNKRLGTKSRSGRINRFSYLAGLVAGAIINKINPRSLEKDFPSLLDVYGRGNGQDGKPFN